jgi:DNA-binding NtrC family response regulator
VIAMQRDERAVEPMWSNLLIGGEPGGGKSVAAWLLTAHAALRDADPAVPIGDGEPGPGAE